MLRKFDYVSKINDSSQIYLCVGWRIPILLYKYGAVCGECLRVFSSPLAVIYHLVGHCNIDYVIFSVRFTASRGCFAYRHNIFYLFCNTSLSCEHKAWRASWIMKKGTGLKYPHATFCVLSAEQRIADE